MKEQRLSIAAHNAARAWGGGEIAQTALLDGLRRRGHEVVFYCNHDVVAKEAAALGIESRISYLGGDAALHHAWRFARVLRRQQPDALILGFYSKNLLAALGGRLARVPRVVARIELQRSKPSLKYRFVLNTWVDTIVTVADSVRRVYLAAGYAAACGHDSQRLRVWLSDTAAGSGKTRMLDRWEAVLRGDLGLPARPS